MTYISWFSDFALYLEYYLLDKCHTWDISSLWPNYWRQNISVGVTYISWFSDFALYLEYYLLDKCHTWDISSMWPNEWPLTISRSLWPIFHGSVILPFIFITISWRIVISGLLYLCDKMIYIQIHLGQCDLYYMVEWFRHITWKLFHRLFHFEFLNDKNVTI